MSRIGDSAVRAAPRILYLDHTAAPGGGEIALLNLIQALDRARFQPVIALFSDGPLRARLVQAGVETHLLPLAPGIVQARKDRLGPASLLRLRDIGRLVGFILRLARFIREQNIALVHTNSLKADLIGGLAARLAGRPLIWHVRDRIERDYLPASMVRSFRHLCRLLPHYVIANSYATLRTLRLPSHKGSAVVYSGVPLPPRPKVEAHADPENWPASPRIGLIGRISPWKGQDVFLRAAALARQRFPRARFLIVGEALFDEREYARHLRDLCTALGLNESVEFTGYREDIRAVIASLDIVVHASTIPEPFGQVIVEGMAQEKPVIATNGGGVPETIVDGQTGLLVPMGDHAAMAQALCRLLADPAHARQMGKRGRERVARLFTIEQTARQVERIYDRLLEEMDK